VSETSAIAKLEASIKVYTDCIASFERVRDQMLARRHGAIDSVMVHLDESLRLNDRTLGSLRRVLDAANDQLLRERAREHRA
jgi:hypothetical protein